MISKGSFGDQPDLISGTSLHQVKKETPIPSPPLPLHRNIRNVGSVRPNLATLISIYQDHFQKLTTHVVTPLLFFWAFALLSLLLSHRLLWFW